MSVMLTKRPLSLIVAVNMGLGIFSFNANAEDHTFALEEVVVTAQKREESLQDVSVSVAVVTGDELAKQHKNSVADLAKIVPSFTFGEGSSDSGRNIMIRGVGTQSFSRTVDQSVGTVVDGVVSGSVSSSLLDFSDVERLEVLRGPQGMLFGKNASAGLLNITTKAPSDVLTYGALVRAGSNQDRAYSGYVSGSLVENTLLGRLSLYRNTRDPIIKNIYTGGQDFNDRDEWGGRVKLIWRASDELDIKLSYMHAEREHICCSAVAREVAAGGLASLLGVPYGEENVQVSDNDSAFGTTDVDTISLDVNYQLGDHTLTSITSSSSEELFSNVRADQEPRTVIPINQSETTVDQITQELRLTSALDQKISYVVGLYYYKKDTKRDFQRIIDVYGLGATPAPGLAGFSLINDLDASSKGFAAFGQANWNISDAARLALGVRYNVDKLNHNQIVDQIPGSFPTEAPVGSIDASRTDRAWSWRIIGEYDIAEDAMAYASIAQGYKGPGANSLSSGPTSGDIFVEPEIPTNYELGIKSQWLDNRLRFNGTVFLTRFEDFQASASVPNAFPPIFFLTNAGELETKGVEVELTAQVSENLRIQSAIAYTDATFKEWQDAPCFSGQSAAQGCIAGAQDLSGGDMPNSPKWAVSSSFNYDIPLKSDSYNAFINGTYFWRDEVQYSTTNNPDLIGDSYGILDFTAGISTADDRYTLEFFVKNALDKFYVTGLNSGASLVGIPVSQYVDYTYKRRFGVSFKANF